MYSYLRRENDKDRRFIPYNRDVCGCRRKVFERIQKAFSAHLEEEVTRACNYMFLTLYATVICDMAKETGLLKVPPVNSVCDVMIQHN